MKWEEEEIVIDLYGTRSKKYSAFILALGAYLFLVSLLLMNLTALHPLDEKVAPLPFHTRRPLGKPAPVRFAHPQQVQPPQQTLIAPPQKGPTPTKAAAPQKHPAATQLPKKIPTQSPVAAATLPPQPEEHPELPTLPAKDQPPTEEPSHTEEASAPPPTAPTRHVFQSRSSWFKKSDSRQNVSPQSSTFVAEPKAKAHQPPETPIAEKLNSSFRQFLDREAKTTLHGSEEAGSGGPSEGHEHGKGSGSGQGSGSGSASRQAHQLGQELFLTQLVYTICDASHQTPLRLNGERIPLHITILRITINRNRQVERIVMDQASPDERINSYLKNLVRNTNLPQLPADWEGETLTVPLRVRIETHPQMNEIRLIPASW